MPETDVDPIEASLFAPAKRSASSANQMRPSLSYWQDARARLIKNKAAVASAVFILLLTLAAIIVPPLLPYTYDQQEIWNKHAKPSLGEQAQVVDPMAITYEPVLRPIENHEDASFESSSTGDDPYGSLSGSDFVPTPKKLSLIGEATTLGIIFQWEDVKEADGFQIYRSIVPDTLGIPLEEPPPDHLSFHDETALSYGRTYYYRVVAYSTMGESEPSEPLEVTPAFAMHINDAKKSNPDAKHGDEIHTGAHIFGTDQLGRDLLSRIMMGARISLFFGFCAPFAYIFIGVVFGCLAGFLGGFWDDIMMRITDVMSTIPELLVVILLQVVLGPGIDTLLIAMVLSAWARSARQIRGEVLRLRESEFIHAAKVLGTPTFKTLFRHLVPNVAGTILVMITLAVPQAIFTEAFLSFIGLGIAPPMASWGTVTKEAAEVFLTYPHELIIPSLFISFTMLAFNLFGDGLRDALDPKLRGAS